MFHDSKKLSCRTEKSGCVQMWRSSFRRVPVLLPVWFKSVWVVLRCSGRIFAGPNDHTIAQIKDAVRDGLRAVKNTLEDGAVILVSARVCNISALVIDFPAPSLCGDKTISHRRSDDAPVAKHSLSDFSLRVDIC
jgi:hypothetical protein